jgi:hypothetical protein
MFVLACVLGLEVVTNHFWDVTKTILLGETFLLIAEGTMASLVLPAGVLVSVAVLPKFLHAISTRFLEILHNLYTVNVAEKLRLKLSHSQSNLIRYCCLYLLAMVSLYFFQKIDFASFIVGTGAKSALEKVPIAFHICWFAIVIYAAFRFWQIVNAPSLQAIFIWASLSLAFVLIFTFGGAVQTNTKPPQAAFVPTFFWIMIISGILDLASLMLTLNLLLRLSNSRKTKVNGFRRQRRFNQPSILVFHMLADLIFATLISFIALNLLSLLVTLNGASNLFSNEQLTNFTAEIFRPWSNLNLNSIYDTISKPKNLGISIILSGIGFSYIGCFSLSFQIGCL